MTIDQLKAGTPGPYSVVIEPDDWVAVFGSESCVYRHDLGYNDGVDLVILANARRVAHLLNADDRLPDLEAAYLAATARVAVLEQAKWEVQHIDTKNDFVLVSMARDDETARADRAEAELAQMRKDGSHSTTELTSSHLTRKQNHERL